MSADHAAIASEHVGGCNPRCMGDTHWLECDHDSQFIRDELGGHWRCLKCGHHPQDCPCEEGTS